MRLRTSLTRGEVFSALHNAYEASEVTPDVHFVKFTEHRSSTHPHAFELSMGTFVQRSGPTIRNYKNSGTRGAYSEFAMGEAIWAPTYQEWGWFMARIFAADPRARFGTGTGGYNGVEDFNARTDNAFIIPEPAKLVHAEATRDKYGREYIKLTEDVADPIVFGPAWVLAADLAYLNEHLSERGLIFA